MFAEAFGMAMPVPDLRERVDAATAEHIANQIPAGGVAREAMLCELLEPVVAGAIASCREAHDAWAGAAAAEETQRRTQRAGYFRIESLQERAAALTWRAADLMMIAHMRAEEAEGVARAVGLARSGESWRPRDVRREAEELFPLRAWRGLTCGNAERIPASSCRRLCRRSGCRDYGGSTQTGA